MTGGSGTLPPAAGPPRPLPDPRWPLLAAAIALLAIAASATSLRNGYAYDDRWIVVENARVHELRALWHYFAESYWPMRNGAALYRPFVIIAYSVQWAIGGGAPLIFHLTNVALGAACAVAVFWVAGFLVPVGVAWLAAALFAVHPVHVEAIANVVGQAELWAALIVLCAMGLYLRDRRDGPLSRETGVLLWALFTAGIFTKEHVVVLPALLVMAELVLLDDAPLWPRLRRLRLLLWPLAVSVAVFLAARVQVIGAIGGDVEHPSLMHRTMLERTFIMLNVVPEYGRLLLVPARLYADYSPRQLEVSPTLDLSQLGGLLLVISTVALFVLALRRWPPVAFGLLWLALFIAPVSNILIPTGILVAERTLYLPSVGAMLVLAVGMRGVQDRLNAERSSLRRVLPLLVAIVLALGLVRSSTRNGFWHDNKTTFSTMVDDAPLNFKAHYAWGSELFDAHRAKEGELEWRIAIALMPHYHAVYVDLGHKYREAHLCEAALQMYNKALRVEPDLPVVRVSIAACQLELARWHDARRTSRVAIADGTYRRAFRFIIDRADSALVAGDSIDPTIGAKWLARRKLVGK